MAGTDDCVVSIRVSPFSLYTVVVIVFAVMRLVASLPDAVDLFDSPSKSHDSHKTRLVQDETLVEDLFENATRKHPIQSQANLTRTSLIHAKRKFVKSGTGNDLLVTGRHVADISSHDSNSKPENNNNIRLFLYGSTEQSSNTGRALEWWIPLPASRRLLPDRLIQRNGKRLDVAEGRFRFLSDGDNEVWRDANRKQKTRTMTNLIPQVTFGGLRPEEDQLDDTRAGINAMEEEEEDLDRTTGRPVEFAETWSPHKTRIEEVRIPVTLLPTIPPPLQANTTFVSTETIATAKSVNVVQTLSRLPLDSSNSSSDGLPQIFRSLPKAIIIGVKKCGTRALLEFLRAHPDVRATGPETHFFDKNYDLGLDWYRQQMPLSRSDQMTIEKTPSYFVTESVPQRIFRMSRDTKLLVVVRDPVTRAVSHYTQVITKHSNIPSFERLAFSPNRTNSSSSSSTSPIEVNASWGALQIGLYAKHLERWLRYFPLDRMHFVSGEGLISDPATELDKVQDFLGLRRAVTRDQFFFSPAKKGFPCLKKPSVVSPHQQRLHCLGKNKGRSHPDVDASLISSLRRFFRPHNERFYRMTRIDFGWP